MFTPQLHNNSLLSPLIIETKATILPYIDGNNSSSPAQNQEFTLQKEASDAVLTRLSFHPPEFNKSLMLFSNPHI